MTGISGLSIAYKLNKVRRLIQYIQKEYRGGTQNTNTYFSSFQGQKEADNDNSGKVISLWLLLLFFIYKLILLLLPCRARKVPYWYSTARIANFDTVGTYRGPLGPTGAYWGLLGRTRSAGVP